MSAPCPHTAEFTALDSCPVPSWAIGRQPGSHPSDWQRSLGLAAAFAPSPGVYEIGSVAALGLDANVPIGALLGGKYRLTRRIGHGASGAVYEAEHAELGRRVAIKLLRRSVESDRARQRFAREARLLARLEHENIVNLLDAGNDAEFGHYLVLEFIRGSTLREALPSFRGAPLRHVLEIVRQLASGLGHAHAAGIVHRDLKPENVMLTSHADGRPLLKILDFGIARLCEADDASLTTSGTALGTAAYMAPEQARGERDIDQRADVFAVGVIVYELLAGARPFDGSSYNETLFQILTKPHTPLQRMRQDLPAEVCGAVERALLKERAQRFPEIDDFSRALSTALRTSQRASETAELETREMPLESVDHGIETAQPVVARSASGSVSVQRTKRSLPLARALPGVVIGLLLGVLLDRWQGLKPSVGEVRLPRSEQSVSAPTPPVESALATDAPAPALASPTVPAVPIALSALPAPVKPKSARVPANLPRSRLAPSSTNSANIAPSAVVHRDRGF